MSQPQVVSFKDPAGAKLAVRAKAEAIGRLLADLDVTASTRQSGALPDPADLVRMQRESLEAQQIILGALFCLLHQRESRIALPDLAQLRG